MYVIDCLSLCKMVHESVIFFVYGSVFVVGEWAVTRFDVKVWDEYTGL